jgi:EamA domain-containing membrane protein RarD
MSWLEYIGARMIVMIFLVIVVVLIAIAGWGVRSKVKFLRNKPRLVFGIIFFGMLMFLEYVVFG